MNRVLLSSRRQDWRTPRWLFDRLHARYRFTKDVFASDRDALLDDYWTAEDDALVQDWAGIRGFGNPKYGSFLPRAFKKAVGYDKAADMIRGVSAELLVFLVPCRMDPGYWRRFVWPIASDVHILSKRLVHDSTCMWDGCDALSVGLVKASFTVKETGAKVSRPTLCADHLEPLKGAWETGPLEAAPFGSCLIVYRHRSVARCEGYARVSHLEI